MGKRQVSAETASMGYGGIMSYLCLMTNCKVSGIEENIQTRVYIYLVRATVATEKG